jgi:hypothetical protein
MHHRSGEDIDITIRHDCQIESISSQHKELDLILSGKIG